MPAVDFTQQDLDLLRRMTRWFLVQSQSQPQIRDEFIDNRNTQVFLTPSGGIPARAGTGTIGDACGFADCQPVWIDDNGDLQNAGSDQQKIWNMSGYAAGENKLIQASKDPWGRWIAHFEDCDE